MARLAKRLAEHDLLRPGLTEKSAAHTLWCSPASRRSTWLYTGRGLSTNAGSDVLTATAEAAVAPRRGVTPIRSCPAAST